MEKFKKVIELRGGLIGNNKYDDFIWGELESRNGGDWNVYEDGDIVSYDIDLLEKNDDEELNYIDCWNWMCLNDEDKVLLEDLKEYVGDGICYDGNYGNWYNVEFKSDVMVISFIFNIKI